jgi:hypothetical protein
MALVKKTRIDTEVTSIYKYVVCHHRTWVEEGGVVVGAEKTLTHTILPGDDVTNEPAEIQAIVTAVQTPDVVDAYNAMVVAQALDNNPTV